jgi:hypothetical protein
MEQHRCVYGTLGSQSDAPFAGAARMQEGETRGTAIAIAVLARH